MLKFEREKEERIANIFFRKMKSERELHGLRLKPLKYIFTE